MIAASVISVQLRDPAIFFDPNFIGARMLVAGKLYEKGDRYELFLKLLRVETGEVLSVTRMKIDRSLGLDA